MRWIPRILVAAYAALGLSWSVTNAPFIAPDETQHYLRALGIRTDDTLAAPRTAYTGPILSPRETEWRRKLTRAATVPPGMSPDGLDCAVFQPNVTPECAEAVVPNRETIVQDTDVGSYAPLPYLLPSVATSFGDDATSAGRYGRLAVLLTWVALLAAAAWMLWDPRVGGLSLAGLVVAITPTAVFVGSSLGNSSLEVAASVAFFSALLRLTRGANETSRSAWVIAAVSGAALVLSRSLGLVWLLCGLAIVVALIGPSRFRELVRRSARPAALTSGALLLALGLAATWELAYGPRVGVTLIPSPSSLYDGVHQLRYALEGLIGRFGYEDVRLGTFGLAVWASMVAVLVGAAAWFGARGERRALLVALALAVVVPIYIYAAVTSQQGIVTQGRHLLPLMVAVPLLSGEVLRRRLPERTPGWSWALLPALCVGAAVTQMIAWWVNSHRYAVGVDGPWWFQSDPVWSPPGGWTVWTVVTIIGALLIVATSVQSLRAYRDAGA